MFQKMQMAKGSYTNQHLGFMKKLKIEITTMEKIMEWSLTKEEQHLF